MENKVLQFDKSVDRYLKLSDNKIKEKDFLSALSFLFSAYKIDSENLEVITALADLYANMNLMEISNKYWFIYLDKAPKEQLAIAYEELAINYFYLDNFWSSSYYFHKKLSVDGFISKEGLSQEIIDFFSGEELKKTAYRVVYPPERANYSYEIKKAKHFIAVGGFSEGALELSKIPLEQMDEETLGELAVCYFMSDDLDKAEEVCRYSLKKHGDNITAFCHLSTIYDMKEDFDNSEFYYQKALALRTGDKGESYKIATCAIERQDHENVCKCIEKILEERPYEYAMRFFYALSLANLKDYERAEKELKKAYLIDPSDQAIKFYLDYITGLKNEGSDYLDLMPFNYIKDMLEKVVNDFKKKVSSLIKHPDRIYSALKKQDIKTMVSWGLKCNDSDLMHDIAYMLSLCFTPFAKNLVLETLLLPDIREETKRVLTYVCIVNGVKEKFGAVASSFFVKVKPKKLLCEKDKKDGGLYLSAYALCISKMLFFDVKLDKIAKVCDRVYKTLKGVITEAEVTNEEIAGLMLYLCEFDLYSSVERVTKTFTITDKKLKTLKKLFEGNKNGKNNWYWQFVW